MFLPNIVSSMSFVVIVLLVFYSCFCSFCV